MAKQEPLTLEWVKAHLESREGILFYRGTQRRFPGRADLSKAQAAWALEYGVIDSSVFARNVDLPPTLDNLIQWNGRQNHLYWWYGKHPLQRVKVEPVRIRDDLGFAFVWITPKGALPPPASPFLESVERRMSAFAKATEIRECQIWQIPWHELVALKGKRSLARLANTTRAMVKAMHEQRSRLDWPLQVYRKGPISPPN